MSFRRTIPFLCSFLLLLPLSISLGRCSDISFSLCWFNKNHVLESHSCNIWLNGTALGPLRKTGKLTSLTVYPGVENKLALQCGRSILAWTFTLNQRTKHTKVKGKVKPTVQPTNATQSFLQILGPSDVFACENSTLFFYQEKGFFLAIGYSSRLPLRLESRSNSVLLLSWDAPYASATEQANFVGLYSPELASFSLRRLETTTDPHYRFTALESCSVYVACVAISGTHSLTCLSTITDPDLPRDLQVSWTNSSSLSVSWDCPQNRRYSAFLLTVFLHRPQPPLDSLPSQSPVEEKNVWVQDPPQWTVSDLPPCARLSFELQTVCVSGAETRYSPQMSHKGNSDQSNILNLALSSCGPDWYTLSWDVGSFSSVSRFRLFHDGEEQASTLNTSFTMSNLQPCQLYSATVEAICGEGTVMDAQTVQVHTVPRGVSGLHFLPGESAAVWTPGSDGSDVSFMFELSQADGGEVLWSGTVSEPHLPLLALQEDLSYRLSVWEHCEGLGSSQRNALEFKSENSALTPRGRAAIPSINGPQHDPHNIVGLIVPWTLPDDLWDETSDSWAQMVEILQNRMDQLLTSMKPAVKVKLLNAEPADKLEHTQFQFLTLKKPKRKNNNKDKLEPLWMKDSLPMLPSLMLNNVRIDNGVIHWQGPDLCQSSPCPQNSICLNTLGSFSCLCTEGHYDIRALLKNSASALPVCNDKGMFSRCLDKQLMGGISKLYLSSRLQGALNVSLNHGECEVNETKDFYHFKIPQNQNQCGTRRLVNESHIELLNFLTVTGGGGPKSPSVRVLLKCVYPRHYLRTALIRVDLEWLASFSIVVFNSSLQLGLHMNLFRDHSFSSIYSDTVMLTPDETLFFEVSLQTSDTFIQDIRLQVESCWATESTDPQDQVQGTFLQDSCLVDDTFSWLSQNGASQSSRFAIQMFQLPLSLPLYFHCRAAICGPQENCTKICSSDPRVKRSVSPSETRESRAAVVSVGPLVVTKRRALLDKTHNWAERKAMITIVAGSLGILAATFLFVSAVKAVMNYYEKRRPK